MGIFNLIDPLCTPKRRVGVECGKLISNLEQKLKTHYLIIVSVFLIV